VGTDSVEMERNLNEKNILIIIVKIVINGIENNEE